MSIFSNRAGAQLPKAKPCWRFDLGGCVLTIERSPAGRWVAVYGGFSRVESKQLSEAIAVAAGAHTHEPWVSEVARRIQSDRART